MSLLSFSACETASDQSSDVTETGIKMVYPDKIATGQTIFIVGNNFAEVTTIVLPGDISVTNFERTGFNQLSVIAPAGLKDGFVVLKAGDKQYTAPNEIKAVSPSFTTLFPASIKTGEELTIKGDNLIEIKQVILPDNVVVDALHFKRKSDSEIKITVPLGTINGTGMVKLVALSGEEIPTANITIEVIEPEEEEGMLQPVKDPSYVFFDFDGKNSWWGSYGKVENDPSLSLSGNYFRINQNLPGGWVDFFWRNSKNDFKTDGVTVDEWAVKMDVNVFVEKTQDFKFRLNGTDGDFWAIIPGFVNRGDWYTVVIPLTDFKDADGFGTNHLPNVQNVNADFGLATAGAAGMVNMCIDNIRFDKIK